MFKERCRTKPSSTSALSPHVFCTSILPLILLFFSYRTFQIFLCLFPDPPVVFSDFLLYLVPLTGRNPLTFLFCKGQSSMSHTSLEIKVFNTIILKSKIPLVIHPPLLIVRNTGVKKLQCNLTTQCSPCCEKNNMFPNSWTLQNLTSTLSRYN